MESRRFEVRSVDVSLMKIAPYNPRVELTPMDREWRSIENSLDSFGYIEPIVWNERTGNIVGGHMRFKVLKERGRLPKEIECVVVDLSEDDEKACNMALNKATGLWDRERLDSLLEDLKGGRFDMDGFGFEEIEFDWDDVKDLSEDTYEEPDNPRTTCPHCGFTDESRHFRKTSKPDGGGS